MRGKAITARKQKAAELARADRLNRCPMCLVALAKDNGIIRWADFKNGRNVRYCSPGCANDAELDAAARGTTPGRG